MRFSSRATSGSFSAVSFDFNRAVLTISLYSRTILFYQSGRVDAFLPGNIEQPGFYLCTYVESHNVPPFS